MNPVDFEGMNTVFGVGQPQYLDLPALRCGDLQGTVWSCWELDDEDIKDIIRTRKLWVGQLTFNKPLSPQMVSTVMPGEVSLAAYKERQK